MSYFDDAASEIQQLQVVFSPYVVPASQLKETLVRWFGDNDVVTIHLRGWWPRWWSAWFTALVLALAAYPMGWADIATARVMVGTVLLSYILMEPIGTWRAQLAIDRKQPENAHTASQLMQRLRQESKGRSRWYQGYMALVNGFAALTSVAVGFMFWPLPPVAIVAGGMTFGYIQPHWTDRGNQG